MNQFNPARIKNLQTAAEGNASLIEKQNHSGDSFQKMMDEIQVNNSVLQNNQNASLAEKRKASQGPVETVAKSRSAQSKTADRNTDETKKTKIKSQDASASVKVTDKRKAAKDSDTDTEDTAVQEEGSVEQNFLSKKTNDDSTSPNDTNVSTAEELKSNEESLEKIGDKMEGDISALLFGYMLSPQAVDEEETSEENAAVALDVENDASLVAVAKPTTQDTVTALSLPELLANSQSMTAQITQNSDVKESASVENEANLEFYPLEEHKAASGKDATVLAEKGLETLPTSPTVDLSKTPKLTVSLNNVAATTPHFEMKEQAFQLNQSFLNASNPVGVLSQGTTQKAATTAATVENPVMKMTEDVEFQKNIQKQVETVLKAEIRKKGSEVNIQIEPPEWGKVHIKIDYQNKEMNLSMMAESPQVKIIIDRYLGELRQSLIQDGITLGQLQVSVGQQQLADGSNQEAPDSQERAIVKPLEGADSKQKKTYRWSDDRSSVVDSHI